MSIEENWESLRGWFAGNGQYDSTFVRAGVLMDQIEVEAPSTAERWRRFILERPHHVAIDALVDYIVSGWEP